MREGRGYLCSNKRRATLITPAKSSLWLGNSFALLISSICCACCKKSLALSNGAILP
jgi:hypothetical protein